MKYTVKTPASTLPVSVADMKTHLRVETYSDHDDLIESYIKAAARSFEQKANLCIQEQTWTLFLNESELTDTINFYKYPIKSVSSIKYYDDDNSLQTMDAGNYTVINGLRPAQILIDDVPSVYERADAVQIEFVAGFTSVPDDILLAIKERVYKVYNNPDDFVEMKLTHFDKVARDYRCYDE